MLAGNKNGFFLMSFLAVTLILGLLSISTGKHSQSNNLEENEIKKTIEKMNMIAQGITKFRLHNNTTELTELAHLISKPTTMSDCLNTLNGQSYLTGWCGPYLYSNYSNQGSHFFKDYWGNPFVLSKTNSSESNFELKNKTGTNYTWWKSTKSGDFNPETFYLYKYKLLSCGRNNICEDFDDIVFII